ncbi:ATP-binding cassette domain-containing protein [candidate division KSB3 bacterium]|uniref:ATP-binding cassette domain-containing protein n=1 Tax=candidate division KSB3 bacterium TaxID=2044937 RepID=A0A9D5Q3X3_9BACT|nr:ATP-binding cassette domain-containing protein [candidate division KSB3 bacterium]MBD3322950.1 ATP-binding cassette domain-containing protein [candidate division KSB3 bacterium]
MYFEIKNIKVNYDRVRALKGISMQMQEGEIITLLGANGAGKTTTLRAITGLAQLSSGEIWFNDQRIDGLPPQKIVGMGIAMVPEGRHVYPLMSVKDNLLMGAYRRNDKQKIAEDLERIYTLFPRLKERLKQQGGNLSGGEQQMVAIGRALMAAPKLLLLDEPSLGIAPIIVQGIARDIVRINKEEKVSVILVEQNARMALKISKHGYVLETGQIALADKSENLIDNDHVRKFYLGG